MSEDYRSKFEEGDDLTDPSSRYGSPLAALLGEEPKEDVAPEDVASNALRMVTGVIRKIIKTTSVVKFQVFNMDREVDADKYSVLVSADSVAVIKEEGNFASYEEKDPDSSKKDVYYKHVVKYRQIDIDKFIEGFINAVKSSLITPETAYAAIVQQFPKSHEKEGIREKLEAAHEEVMKKRKEEEVKRKKELAEIAKTQKEEYDKKITEVMESGVPTASNKPVTKKHSKSVKVPEAAQMTQKVEENVRFGTLEEMIEDDDTEEGGN